MTRLCDSCEVNPRKVGPYCKDCAAEFGIRPILGTFDEGTLPPIALSSEPTIPDAPVEVVRRLSIPVDKPKPPPRIAKIPVSRTFPVPKAPKKKPGPAPTGHRPETVKCMWSGCETRGRKFCVTHRERVKTIGRLPASITVEEMPAVERLWTETQEERRTIRKRARIKVPKKRGRPYGAKAREKNPHLFAES